MQSMGKIMRVIGMLFYTAKLYFYCHLTFFSSRTDLADVQRGTLFTHVAGIYIDIYCLCSIFLKIVIVKNAPMFVGVCKPFYLSYKCQRTGLLIAKQP